MKLSRTTLNYVIAFILSLCCICSAGALGINIYGGSIISTPNPSKILDTPLPISTVIALTFSFAGTQTESANPIPLSTATLIPVIENVPTATVFIFDLQTSVAQPTEFIYSTNTPFTISTQAIQPTLPPQSSVCSCSADTLNCPGFVYQSNAQACFNYCIAQGAGDIHGLDDDDDGIACESLP